MPRPRRSPPTALRLIPGVPARSFRRHALPSVPVPAFHPSMPMFEATSMVQGPVPRPRSRHNSIENPPNAALIHNQQSLPITSLPSRLPFAAVSLSDCEAFAHPYPYVPSNNSSTSSLSSLSNSSFASLSKVNLRDRDAAGRSRSSSNASMSSSSSGGGSPRVLRGPWDHSGCIPLPFNVEEILKAPEPVAISPGGMR
ncbi:hypothetical protein BDN71DRAFT_1451785 [Pleurotus eryngii]|uniref:Uncharacterized protein n=1 Tax=Pleurotus eryngii TaxID=5323 RepID=A0A9P6D4F7_PLEER|nr:hypothetical protein BDN71DRAFT_1451785 [Pleurotus eryngii]